MNKILTTIISVAAILIAAVAYVHDGRSVSVGATANPGANALYEQSLSQPLGTTDASMFVTSGADVQGNLLPLNSYQCLSIDTGQPNFEAVCGTITTTSTSGLTLLISLRGLSTQTATTSNASYIFQHRRGADVRITDFPTLTILNNQLGGVQSIPSPIFYSSNFTAAYWATAASNTIVTLGQAAAIAQAGCGNASEFVDGCSQLATALQAASSTLTGSTGARLVIPANIGTDTPTFGCSSGYTGVAGAGCNVLGDLTGHVWKSIIANLGIQNLWTAINTFSASTTLNATTTIAASSTVANALRLNGVNYAFPSTQSVGLLNNNGSGVLTWGGVPQYSLTNTSGPTVSASGVATSTAILNIPAGILGASSTIRVIGNLSCNGGTSPVCTYSLRDSGGTTFATCNITGATTNNYGGFLNFAVANQSSINSQIGVSTCFATDQSAGATNAVGGGTTATTFNTGNALNLVMVVSVNNGSVTLSNYSIVVNP